MKTILIFILLISFNLQSQTKFAVIGDYGKDGTNELNVSNLVKSWNPDIVITLGDNNYELGEASTIDINIGKYYHGFIYPYYGIYGAGDTINRFFPSLGNHDLYTASGAAYLNYFTLPGNERYYDFVKGNVHFFAINSDPSEPHGVDSNSVQAHWLKSSLAASNSKYNVVYFHHPPYSSSDGHGSEVIMQWPFKEWGATIVLAGHDHTYERLSKNGFIYIVNGLGGKSIYGFATPVPESQFRYNNNYGAMLINSYPDSIVFKFYSVTPSLKDNFKILPAKKVLNLTMNIEGLYDSLTNKMVKDTVRVLLRNVFPPFTIADSSTALIDSTGKGVLNFSKAENATDYFITLKHRNAIETWSASGNSFILNKQSYDFTFSSSRAFGNNLILKGSKYCLYSGDQNQDGVIELEDMLKIYNDGNQFVSGYKTSDLNGDLQVDLSDLLIAYNNNERFVIRIIP